jgi:hypothetical protein
MHGRGSYIFANKNRFSSPAMYMYMYAYVIYVNVLIFIYVYTYMFIIVHICVYQCVHLYVVCMNWRSRTGYMYGFVYI